MTELEKAARQALEALEDANQGMAECSEELGFDFANEQYDVEQAITALRRALSESVEQPAQDEPGFYGRAAARLSKRVKELEAQQEPVAWVDLLKAADEVVRNKTLWKRFIDGTPLANDIPCWMADFALEHTRPPARETEQQEPLTDEQESKVARLFSDRIAEMCNVDADDHWKYHFDDVLADVQFVLKAAHGIGEKK